jgi:hypothetical protein
LTAARPNQAIGEPERREAVGEIVDVRRGVNLVAVEMRLAEQCRVVAGFAQRPRVCR